VLLRGKGIGRVSCSLPLWKKEALEAVSGVVGVFDIVWRSGGEEDWTSSLVAPLRFNASIFAAIGVLKGSKFSGGSFKG
jgi:hypothetical protein